MNKKANGQKTTAIVLIVVLLLVLGIVIFYVSMQNKSTISKQESQDASDQNQNENVQYVVKKPQTQQESCFGQACNFPQIKSTNSDSTNSGNNGIGGNIVCRKDADCSDGDQSTIDVCVNPATTQSSCTHHTPQCSDLIDNNGDGNVDYPADPNCSSKLDDSESQ